MTDDWRSQALGAVQGVYASCGYDDGDSTQEEREAIVDAVRRTFMETADAEAAEAVRDLRRLIDFYRQALEQVALSGDQSEARAFAQQALQAFGPLR